MTEELKKAIYDGMAKVPYSAEAAARFLGERQTFVFRGENTRDLCFGTVGEDGVFRIYTPSGRMLPRLLSTCFLQDVEDSHYGVARGFVHVLAGDGTVSRPINYTIDSRSIISLYGEELPCSSLLDSVDLSGGGYCYMIELVIRYAHTPTHNQAPTVESTAQAVDDGKG